jgi:hypothetical protein
MTGNVTVSGKVGQVTFVLGMAHKGKEQGFKDFKVSKALNSSPIAG